MIGVPRFKRIVFPVPFDQGICRGDGKEDEGDGKEALAKAVPTRRLKAKTSAADLGNSPKRAKTLVHAVAAPPSSSGDVLQSQPLLQDPVEQLAQYMGPRSHSREVLAKYMGPVSAFKEVVKDEEARKTLFNMWMGGVLTVSEWQSHDFSKVIIEQLDPAQASSVENVLCFVMDMVKQDWTLAMKLVMGRNFDHRAECTDLSSMAFSCRKLMKSARGAPCYMIIERVKVKVPETILGGGHLSYMLRLGCKWQAVRAVTVQQIGSMLCKPTVLCHHTEADPVMFDIRDVMKAAVTWQCFCIVIQHFWGSIGEWDTEWIVKVKETITQMSQASQ